MEIDEKYRPGIERISRETGATAWADTQAETWGLTTTATWTIQGTCHTIREDITEPET